MTTFNSGLTEEAAKLANQADARDQLGAGGGIFPSSLMDFSNVTITGGTAKVNQGNSLLKCRVGGMLHGLPNITPVGNITTGEDNLIQYSIRGGTLAADGDVIRLTGYFQLADAGTIKAYFNGTLITGASVATDETVPIQDFTTDIIRLSSTSVLISSYNAGAGVTGGAIVTDLTLTSDIVFKFTGEATDGAPATNDVIQKCLIGFYWPAN